MHLVISYTKRQILCVYIYVTLCERKTYALILIKTKQKKTSRNERKLFLIKLQNFKAEKFRVLCKKGKKEDFIELRQLSSRSLCIEIKNISNKLRYFIYHRFYRRL